MPLSTIEYKENHNLQSQSTGQSTLQQLDYATPQRVRQSNVSLSPSGLFSLKIAALSLTEDIVYTESDFEMLHIKVPRNDQST